MCLSDLEKDILSDFAQDAHELWELYGFVRYHQPKKGEGEVINIGRDLIKTWIGRGWLKAVRSRAHSDLLSGDELLAIVDKLGVQAADPKKGKIVLELRDNAYNDVDWLQSLRGQRK